MHGPLDEAESVAEEVLLVAQFEELLEALDAVGVEVVDREGLARVLVDEGKRRAGDGGFGHAIGRADALDQMRLAGAEVAVERHDVAGSEVCGKAAAQRQRSLGRVGLGREYRF